MTATLNGINSVCEEIARLSDILAEDVAGLEALGQKTSAEAIAAKKKAAGALESSRLELVALRESTNKWTRERLSLREGGY